MSSSVSVEQLGANASDINALNVVTCAAMCINP